MSLNSIISPNGVFNIPVQSDINCEGDINTQGNVNVGGELNVVGEAGFNDNVLFAENVELSTGNLELTGGDLTLNIGELSVDAGSINAPLGNINGRELQVSGGPKILTGNGAPAGDDANGASKGSLWLRQDGANANEVVYVKSVAGNPGTWNALMSVP
jgi:hypothetical protein